MSEAITIEETTPEDVNGQQAEAGSAAPAITDVTVIGGGPVGMFAAFYSAMRNLDVTLVDSLPELGGQVAALYPEKPIHDIAGFVSGTGAELVGNLKKQIDTFPERITVYTNEEVRGLEQLADGTFTLTTPAREIRTRSVIVAIGSGAFTPRPLAIDYDRERLDGHGVFYFVKHLADFAGKTVAVAGGGDAAIDWALELERIAGKVVLIHRRDNFRALESSVARLKESTVAILTPYKFTSVTGVPDGDGLHIELAKIKSDETLALDVDALLVNYGFTSDNHLLKEWGLPVKRGDLEVDEYLETEVPRIYGVGDAVNYPGKVKLISAGFGEVPRAVNHLAEQLYPDRKQPLHE
ncbi:NAD(P)/FAD-dependent oxidoreductase [Bifidobacterium callitrichos]|uniref:Ferredoxin--NADP reductase n=1 Tax=Bifidobacterium callitrichos TaxID=762209 RepID=A0A5M9ZAD6_9BIFI|nr:NAD(P)/FAD-dependent oxidoreductase [Bifidobacterium callitrichos]KAA8815345.1 NAD(P)/FAD-dependent oxidoreductase [Bifidobacterium callitrichos]